MRAPTKRQWLEKLQPSGLLVLYPPQISVTVGLGGSSDVSVMVRVWLRVASLTVTVKVNYLPEVVEFLYYQQGGWLSVLFGNDERQLCGNHAVYYVMSMEQGTKCWITVRVEVDANKLEFPSVTPRVPAAVWGEREVRDMYGLIPVGLPDERRLVLPDDWPEDIHPLFFRASLEDGVLRVPGRNSREVRG